MNLMQWSSGEDTKRDAEAGTFFPCLPDCYINEDQAGLVRSPKTSY